MFDGFDRSIHSVWPWTHSNKPEKTWSGLEQQLVALLDQRKKLREENHSLQNRQESLVAERASLVAKNEEAPQQGRSDDQPA